MLSKVFNCSQACIHTTPAFFKDQLLVGWDSAVSAATHYEQDDLGIESQWRQGFPRPSRMALGPTQPPIQWVLGAPSRGKAAGAWRSTNPHLAQRRAIPLLPIWTLMTCDRVIFILTFYVIQCSFVKVTSTYRRNYLGLASVRFNMTNYLDKHISWKNHINKMLPKLSNACFVFRYTYSYCNISTLKMIYFVYFHATMEYGFIFWDNSKDSKKVFLQQKSIIRIMTGSISRTSCKPL